MSKRMFDFDEFWKEAEAESAERPTVKVFGEELVLPASLPARVMLRALRPQVNDEEVGVLPYEEVLAQTKALYGPGNVERWLDKGITIAQLADLLNHGISLYLQNEEADVDEGDEGNETRPKRAKKGKTA